MCFLDDQMKIETNNSKIIHTFEFETYNDVSTLFLCFCNVKTSEEEFTNYRAIKIETMHKVSIKN